MKYSGSKIGNTSVVSLLAFQQSLKFSNILTDAPLYSRNFVELLELLKNVVLDQHQSVDVCYVLQDKFTEMGSKHLETLKAV